MFGKVFYVQEVRGYADISRHDEHIAKGGVLLFLGWCLIHQIGVMQLVILSCSQALQVAHACQGLVQIWMKFHGLTRATLFVGFRDVQEIHLACYRMVVVGGADLIDLPLTENLTACISWFYKSATGFPCRRLQCAYRFLMMSTCIYVRLAVSAFLRNAHSSTNILAACCSRLSTFCYKTSCLNALKIRLCQMSIYFLSA